MNKLLITLFVFLSSCGEKEREMERYNGKSYIPLKELSTDSLIQKSKVNLKRVIDKSKHDHQYADSVSGCLDSIKHQLELELKELELNHAQKQGGIHEIHPVKLYENVVVRVPNYLDTIYMHDTIYLDTFATIKETIIKLELMTDKDKAKLKKKREKKRHKKPKFK